MQSGAVVPLSMPFTHFMRATLAAERIATEEVFIEAVAPASVARNAAKLRSLGMGVLLSYGLTQEAECLQQLGRF